MSAVRLLPWVVHEAVEYLAGLFLVIAPFAFDFSEEPGAVRFFVSVGLLILVVAMLTRGPLGVVGALPTKVHAGMDYLLAFLLILAPFLFGFAEVESALYLSVLFGVVHLVATLITRFPLSTGVEPDPAGERGAGAEEHG